MTIIEGQLTYDAEGTEGGLYHSRKLHVPSQTSGLTIGRGYDMKEKNATQIKLNLMAAGVEDAMAELLCAAAGLFGQAAKQFIVDNQLASLEITTDTQEGLFNQTYAAMARDVRRICDKADCVATYGEVDWDNLNPYIKEVLVDLRYRGDYTPASRKRIQILVVNNDLQGLFDDLSDLDNWSLVPPDRLQRRIDFLSKNLAEN